jgi:D-glycero-D-manno-heptose 1,7-bisphosphate phosphatase
MSMLRPAVFLDRDGTLNAAVVREGKPHPPQNADEFRLFDDVPAMCRALKAAGFVLAVATNQPDVGRGTQTQAMVEAIHAKLISLIPEIERIEVCYDAGRGEVSRRRKPEPGMLLDAAAALGIDLSRSWMIGDNWRDIDCGRRAGARTVLIDRGYAEGLRSPPDFRVTSFAEAAEAVLRRP